MSQFPIFRFRPVKRKDKTRYEGQVAGIRRAVVLALIERSQPYHRGDARDRDWLAALKVLSNTDKHRSLSVQVVEVQPTTNFTIARLPDEGAETPAAAWLDGKPIEIVDVKPELTTQVSFGEFSHDGRLVPVIAGLRALHLSTAKLIALFENVR